MGPNMEFSLRDARPIQVCVPEIRKRFQLEISGLIMIVPDGNITMMLFEYVDLRRGGSDFAEVLLK